jgi:hypothetical protein
MSETLWFGAKTWYRLPDAYHKGDGVGQVYEERVVLLRARNGDEAISRAELEAVRYAEQANDGTEYLGVVNVYEMFDDVSDTAEVYSVLRSSPLRPEEFLARYHDSATLHSRSTVDDRDPAS